VCGKHTLPLFILGKSRMRKRARTELCGGRSVMSVPTATRIVRRRVACESALDAEDVLGAVRARGRRIIYFRCSTKNKSDRLRVYPKT
jgi:hypothetical protein